MVNFGSKHEFRQATKKIMKLSSQKYSEVIQDDDTLMSADDFPESNCKNLPRDRSPSHPINIQRSFESEFTTKNVANDNVKSKQNLENEMSGETSNICIREVREIRAGCRRVREEFYQPGYSIGFNEDLLK